MVLSPVLIAVIVIAVLAVVGLAVGLGVGLGLPLANTNSDKRRLVNFISNLCDGVYTFSDENQRYEKPNTKQYANVDDSRYLKITGNELECFTLQDKSMGSRTLVESNSDALGALDVTFEKV